MLLAAAFGAAPGAPPGERAAGAAAARLSASQLAGQRVVYSFAGPEPPAALIHRIRRGQAGAVILFAGNLSGPAGTRALVRRLQAVPRPAGLRAPLLVMVDQEGGRVRRLEGPPARSAARLGRLGPAAARRAGKASGRLLRGAGVNVNLAPVADLARPGSAIAADGRSFGRAPARVARAAVAFAEGARAAGVLTAAKHFPGLGAAPRSTDAGPVAIRLSAAALRREDMRPFRALVAHRVPLVMLSTAAYPALAPGPAALAPAVVRGELRGRLGFRGLTVTDALDTPALVPAGPPGEVAVRAAAAGGDLLIYAGGYARSDAAARALTAALRSGRLRRGPAEASVARSLALRAGLPPQ